MSADLLDSTSFTHEVRQLLEDRVGLDHPVFRTRIGRRIVNHMVDGAIPAARVNGRWHGSRDDVPLAADLLLRAAQAPARRPRPAGHTTLAPAA